jgi:hypothetical protein
VPDASAYFTGDFNYDGVIDAEITASSTTTFRRRAARSKAAAAAASGTSLRTSRFPAFPDLFGAFRPAFGGGVIYFPHA